MKICFCFFQPNKYVRITMDVALICETIIEPPASGDITRENISCKITYTANGKSSIIFLISKLTWSTVWSLFIKEIADFGVNSLQNLKALLPFFYIIKWKCLYGLVHNQKYSYHKPKSKINKPENKTQRTVFLIITVQFFPNSSFLKKNYFTYCWIGRYASIQHW